MHTAVDLVNETKLDNEIKSWLAFAAQKVVEVNALAKALSGEKDEVWSLFFEAKNKPFLYSSISTSIIYIYLSLVYNILHLSIVEYHF